MTQTAIRLNVRVARWAIPVAYLIAYAVRPLLGIERAVSAAAWVVRRGVRIRIVTPAA